MDTRQRRTARLAALSAPADGARKLMVLVGEVKLIEPSRYGHKLVIKHLPDLPFMMAEDLHKRMLKRFGNYLALWDAEESTHLLAVATSARQSAHPRDFYVVLARSRRR